MTGDQSRHLFICHLLQPASDSIVTRVRCLQWALRPL